MRVSVQTFLSPFCFLGVVKVMGLLIAECLSVRYLILQYSLAVRCMSVTLWNAIIAVGICVTSLMIANV